MPAIRRLADNYVRRNPTIAGLALTPRQVGAAGWPSSLAFALLVSWPGWSLAQTKAQLEPISLPLQHLRTPSADEGEYDTLGILIGINGAKPRPFEFDTGSDEFMIQIDSAVPGIEPVPGSKPEMYAYADGNSGYWQQEVQFESLSFFDPRNPSHPVASISGGYKAGRILDRALTKDYYAFKDTRVSQKPIGYRDGTAVYADLEFREKMQKGEPGDIAPVYGTLGVGDFIANTLDASTIGGRTRSGYVVAANANVGSEATPGCAPCAILHLTPSVRAQFTALMPWGKLDYDGYRQQFPESNASASMQYEGSYRYTVSVASGGRKRAVELQGPILFDTGTPDFVFLSGTNAVRKLKAAGYKMGSYELGKVDFKIHGFKDTQNDLEYDRVDIFRADNEDDGDGITIGLPFFQANAVMYDLENRITAYSPYFVSAGDFTTDGAAGDARYLGRITADMGSNGWFGLAGTLSGNGDLTIEKDAVLRLSGVNSYSGATIVAPDAYLYLTGPARIERSSSVVADGVFDITHKGSYQAQWGVPDSEGDTAIRSLSGKGDVQLGAHRLVLTAANGRFDGVINDYGHHTNLGGGLVIAGGRQVLGGKNDYTGLTEVAAGAVLHVAGSLVGDVFVSGTLIVDGEIGGKVTVQKGGMLTGKGKVGSLQVAEGGRSELADKK